MYAEVKTMTLLQVRDCPEDLYKKIAMFAKKQNRTIAQQTVVLLQKGLDQSEPNIERRLQLLQKISARQVSDKAKELDATALLREDRNR